MADILRAKFCCRPERVAALLGTGDALLVEGNRHHDQSWGDCRCARHAGETGLNLLGVLLMQLRASLGGSGVVQWICTGWPASCRYRSPVCALPGCRVYVDQVGKVCLECITDLGPMLQLTDRPAMTAEQLTERDSTVLAIYAQRRDPCTRRNQRCWLCEERRTCTQMPSGWECSTCQEVTGQSVGPGEHTRPMTQEARR